MPTGALVFWLLTGGLCFVIGIFLMWQVEQSGVERWGACGHLFKLGNTVGDLKKEDGGASV
ncbi:hypothetical protein SAMN05660649_02235 [Desulfotomaculum arcticum]|uniref:Uncharacterized protein n=1 Tax=Desulfotruncus arcticus DSM 17038 TaxID=1121424 RepID=A0A1I2TG20_9FIRM|nr:hypothetical protein [Desulfotruncus arcticus]SFG63825.1 hypothetical protein SAMN05660649_02235 [Desulfotomaculum arcticum] [Desulfotruncus arcticus DSM 17038]